MSEGLVPLLSHEYSRMLHDYAKQIDQKKYTSSEGAQLGLLVHSFESLMQYHSELGLDSLVVAPLQELVKTRITQGGIEDELSSLIEIISDDNAPSSKEQKRSS